MVPAANPEPSVIQTDCDPPCYLFGYMELVKFYEDLRTSDSHSHQNFPPPSFNQIAVVKIELRSLEGRVEPVLQLLQLPHHQRHHNRPAAAGSAECGQQGRSCAEETERSAAHGGAGADAAVAEHQDRAGDHIEAHNVAGAPYGDQATAHRVAQLVANFASHQDRAAGHAMAAAAVGGAH